MRDGEDVIRDAWARWNGGLREYDAEVLDPEIEVDSMLARQVFRGAAGLNQWASEVDDQFESWTLSIDEIEPVGPDRFVVRGAVQARGRHSGVDLDQRMTWDVTLRDDRILRLGNTIGWDSE